MPRGVAILLLMSMFAAAAWGQPPAPDGAGAPPGGPIPLATVDPRDQRRARMEEDDRLRRAGGRAFDRGGTGVRAGRVSGGAISPYSERP